MEKKRPNYSLDSFKAAAGEESLIFTSSALQSAAKLGFSRSDINDLSKLWKVSTFTSR